MDGPVKVYDVKKRRQEGPVAKGAATGGWMLNNKGWKALDISGDELLLGATEAGFAGLEVLEDYTLLAGPGASPVGLPLATN
jgi:hypothetical protein